MTTIAAVILLSLLALLLTARYVFHVAAQRIDRLVSDALGES